MKKRNYFQWFTLVELIIVVTILAILATIAFISFQSYTKSARDSNRLASMKNIESSLSIYNTQISSYPLPDDYTTILASWTTIWYEWIVWESISRNIKMSKISTDPITQENYIYYTNGSKNKWQIMWFMEWNEYNNLSFLWIENTYASWTWTKYPRVTWDSLWILLDSSQNRVTWTWVDVLLNWSWTNYTAYFSDNDNLTSSWKDLFSKVYNRRSDLLNDKSVASLDDSLVWYWDMETTTLSWSQVVLKDFSKYGNNWSCYNSVTSVNCWTAWLWPQFINWNWKTWNAMYFDWVDDYIISNFFPNITNKYTIFTKIKLNDINHQQNFLTIQWSNSSVLNVSSSYYFQLWHWLTPTQSSCNSDIKLSNKIFIITWTFDWINQKIYIDGNIKNSKSHSWFLINWSNLFFSLPTVWFQSFWYFYETRLYNRALSDSEIQQLYNSTK
jgi:prepilin-type N-terminal cleavage/methylation domain-containing protein